MPQHPKQADVARLAGVSRTTVSFVLNNRADSRIPISKETRQRVLQAAKELGYEPNAAALSLRLRKTYNIGITIPDLNNPHLQTILCGATHEAQLHDYNLLVIGTEMRPEKERASILELQRRRIDGLIMLPSFANILKEELQRLSEGHSPIVILGNYYQQVSDLDTIIPSHDQGAVQMMKYLLELGHRRIGFILGVIRKPLGKERLEAYVQMLQSTGIPFKEELIIETGVSYRDGYEAATRLLDQQPRPTAILAINDVLALGAMHAAFERGLCVPKDLSVAGFDNNDYSAYLNPALTTIDVNAREIGKQAMRMVIKRIADPERPHEKMRIPYQLVLRASTGPVPQESSGHSALMAPSPRR